MPMIKSFKLLIVSILASVAVFAADNEAPINASVTAGYNNHYIVNGLAKTGGQGFAGFTIGTAYFGVDTYLGGVVLPDSNGLDESHWNIGAGKSFKITENFSLRADLQALRHQSAIVGGRNSIEIAPKIALVNPYVTPYIQDRSLIFSNLSGSIDKLIFPSGISIKSVDEYIKVAKSNTFTFSCQGNLPIFLVLFACSLR